MEARNARLAAKLNNAQEKDQGKDDEDMAVETSEKPEITQEQPQEQPKKTISTSGPRKNSKSRMRRKKRKNPTVF